MSEIIEPYESVDANGHHVLVLDTWFTIVVPVGDDLVKHMSFESWVDAEDEAERIKADPEMVDPARAYLVDVEVDWEYIDLTEAEKAATCPVCRENPVWDDPCDLRRPPLHRRPDTNLCRDCDDAAYAVHFGITIQDVAFARDKYFGPPVRGLWDERNHSI